MSEKKSESTGNGVAAETTASDSDKWNLKSRSEGKPFASDGAQRTLPTLMLTANGFDRASYFHSSFGMPVNEPGYMPTVSERLLRGKLLLEETIETITKGLGLRITYPSLDGKRFCLDHSLIGIKHREGDLYDPVETLDGLADVKVIANGTAVAFGLPMDEADYEVFCSNMSKLDESGKPIVNGITEGYRGPNWESDSCVDMAPESGYRPDQPVGKVLKPANYTPANIAGVIQAEVTLTEAQNEGE